MFSDKITLRAIAMSQDGYGGVIETATNTEVWAKKKSINRTEFYAANANGIDVSATFEVHVDDYNNQTEVAYNSSVYKIIRTYQKNESTVELVCSDKAV